VSAGSASAGAASGETASGPTAAEVRERFIARRGFWSEIWDPVAAYDPGFVAGYLELSTVVTDKGNLDPLLRELLAIANDSVATHQYEAGLRIHIRGARRLGATPAQIVAVLELATTIGVQAALLGNRVLAEVREVDSRAPADAAALADEFRGVHGYWSEHWQRLLDQDPEYFTAYLALTRDWSARREIAPKDRELILTGINVATTHLHADAARAHVSAALDHGASVEEVIAIFECASGLGVHSVTFGAEILADELRLEDGDS
jgi:alkylhydroperoxidase/carboxymuconolactone decarboxylase family protein YurZ